MVYVVLHGVLIIVVVMVVIIIIILIIIIIIIMITGRIYDVTGDYDIPFLLCGSLAVMAGLVITTPVIINKITGRDNWFIKTCGTR